ncbi:hypothetical protein WD019_03150 [Fictibacillus sp. Mic-4]|uniref:hypothetical protein n=1 Tax=Fictibacillus sp. Mic-4 TaxID=3132826 RepID=UPI003CE9D99E
MSKKKYIVVEDFTDLQDKNKVYRKGDAYPNPPNKKVSQKRLDELASDKNRIGAPLIKEITEQE